MVKTYDTKERQFVKEKRNLEALQQHRLVQVKQRREQILDKK